MYVVIDIEPTSNQVSHIPTVILKKMVSVFANECVLALDPVFIQVVEDASWPIVRIFSPHCGPLDGVYRFPQSIFYETGRANGSRPPALREFRVTRFSFFHIQA